MSIEIVKVDDRTKVVKGEPVVVNIGTPSTSVRVKPELGYTQVSLSDSYQVIPYAKRVTTDFDLPDSITQGLFVDMDDLEQALLDEIGNREIAIIDTTAYAKSYADGIEQQVYTNVSATYIGMPALEAYVLSSDFTNASLTYDTGTGLTTASMQEMYARTVAVEGNQAGYDVNLQAVVDDTAALATRTEDLEVSIGGTGGIAARLSTIEGVAAGVFQVWYGAPQELLVGMVKFVDPVLKSLRTTELSVSATDLQFQYLGGALGEDSDGWVRTDSNAASLVADLDTSTAAAIAELQSQVDGSISTWFYSGTPEYSSGDTPSTLWSSSTDTGTDLVTGALVLDIAHNQMYEFLGASELNTDLTAEVFTADRWLAVYKIVLPESDWVAIDTANGNDLEKDSHLGDIYYDNDTGFGYRYSFLDIDDLPDQGIVYSWVAITDGAALEALAAAAAAQATADSKSTTYLVTLADAIIMSNAWSVDDKALNVGDLVIDPADSYKVYRWTGSIWQSVRDAGIGRSINTFSAINSAPPTAVDVGDIWTISDRYYTTTDGTYSVSQGSDVNGLLRNQIKEWNGVAWAEVLYSELESKALIGWAGGASKLIHGPDGSITGWSIADGSHVESTFKINADKFIISDSTNSHQPLTIDATTGLSKFNGIVEFTNTDMDAYDNSNIAGLVDNKVLNPLPARGAETSGYAVGWFDGGITPLLSAGEDIYAPAGGTAVLLRVPGSPTIGSVFELKVLTDDCNSSGLFPVLPGTIYDLSFYTNLFRCDAYCFMVWHDANGTQLGLSNIGNTTTGSNNGGVFTSWPRTQAFITVPSNARYGRLIIRGVVTSNDPYMFVTHALCAEVPTLPTAPNAYTNSSVYNVAAAINNNTTTINGDKITAGSVASNVFAGNVIYNLINGVPATSSTYSMKIDLANGEIHIK